MVGFSIRFDCIRLYIISYVEFHLDNVICPIRLFRTIRHSRKFHNIYLRLCEKVSLKPLSHHNYILSRYNFDEDSRFDSNAVFAGVN